MTGAKAASLGATDPIGVHVADVLHAGSTRLCELLPLPPNDLGPIRFGTLRNGHLLGTLRVTSYDEGIPRTLEPLRGR